MIMRKITASNIQWICIESRDDLDSILNNNYKIIEADNSNTWGYFQFGSGEIIPIGYENLGLRPMSVLLGDKAFIGINELLIGYDIHNKYEFFKYKMPTLFHEFVRFDKTEFIVRDEIGFVGISYMGDERWSFLIDIINTYSIKKSTITGVTIEGETFNILIPSDI